MDGSERKRFGYYLLYSLAFVFIMLVGTYFGLQLQETAKYSFRMMPIFIYSMIFPVVMGVFVGIPSLITNMQKPGAWIIDWVKLIAIGMPFLYIAMLPVIYYSPVSFLVPKFMVAILSTYTPRVISGFMLGYLLISVWGKSPEVK